MEVYIVFTGTVVVGVFSTREKAEECQKKYVDKGIKCWKKLYIINEEIQ